MYVAALLALLGWALHFADPLLFVYWQLVSSGLLLFMVLYEEPQLSSLFGAEYYLSRQGEPLASPYAQGMVR